MLIPTALNGRHAITLDLYGNAEPSEATYSRLERELRDQLVVLRTFAVRTSELGQASVKEPAGELGEIRRALDFVTTWWVASQGPFDEVTDEDRSLEAQLGRAIAVVHVRCFCGNDDDDERTDEFLTVVVRSFFMYGAKDDDGTPIPVLSAVDASRVVRAAEYLIARLSS